MYNFIEQKKTNQIQDFVFFSGLFFLIIIGYLGGLSNTIYFFLYLERNVFMLVVTKILFVIFVILQLIYPNFGPRVLSLIFTPYFLSVCDDQLSYLNHKIKRHPFLVFLILHSLICFSFVHLFMLIFTGIDPSVELFYHFFNLIKLWFFPLGIFIYIIEKTPSHWMTLTDILEKIISDPNHKQAIRELWNQAHITAKKYPNGSKATALVTVSLSGALLWGKNGEDSVTLVNSKTKIHSSTLDPIAVYLNPELLDCSRKLLADEILSTRPWLMITASDIQSSLKVEPVLSVRYPELVKKAYELQIQTLGDLQAKQQLTNDRLLPIQEKVDTAVLTPPTAINSTAVPNPLGSPDTSRVIVYNSKITGNSQDPVVPSCLEWFWSNF